MNIDEDSLRVKYQINVWMEFFLFQRWEKFDMLECF